MQFLTTDSWNFSAFLFFFFFLVNGNSRIGKFFMTREEISIDRFKEVDFSYRFIKAENCFNRFIHLLSFRELREIFGNSEINFQVDNSEFA